MGVLVRLVASLVLVGILLFCVFGYLCTFEPLPPSVQLTWRLVYGFVAAVCLGGLVLVWSMRGTR